MARLKEIGVGRFYETDVFRGYKSGPYIEAATTERISFDAHRSVSSDPDHHPTADFEANTMHEVVVEEISGRLLAGMVVPLCDARAPAEVDDRSIRPAGSPAGHFSASRSTDTSTQHPRQPRAVSAIEPATLAKWDIRDGQKRK